MTYDFAIVMIIGALAFAALLWVTRGYRRQSVRLDVHGEEFKGPELDTWTCPWCDSPRVDDTKGEHVIWACGSSVGVCFGDPIQTDECAALEKAKTPKATSCTP
jgi:hypothetical protein